MKNKYFFGMPDDYFLYGWKRVLNGNDCKTLEALWFIENKITQKIDLTQSIELEINVSKLTEFVGMAYGTLTKSLEMLKDNGLIKMETKQGRGNKTKITIVKPVPKHSNWEQFTSTLLKEIIADKSFVHYIDNVGNARQEDGEVEQQTIELPPAVPQKETPKKPVKIDNKDTKKDKPVEHKELPKKATNDQKAIIIEIMDKLPVFKDFSTTDKYKSYGMLIREFGFDKVKEVAEALVSEGYHYNVYNIIPTFKNAVKMPHKYYPNVLKRQHALKAKETGESLYDNKKVESKEGLNINVPNIEVNVELKDLLRDKKAEQFNGEDDGYEIII